MAVGESARGNIATQNKGGVPGPMSKKCRLREEKSAIGPRNEGENFPILRGRTNGIKAQTRR